MNGNLESESKNQVWAQDDWLKLLEAMKMNLPEKDLAKYNTSEAHLDWEKVAFNTYSAEMCKQKWLEVSREIRKFRTLAEIIVDARDYIKNPYKAEKLKDEEDDEEEDDEDDDDDEEDDDKESEEGSSTAEDSEEGEDDDEDEDDNEEEEDEEDEEAEDKENKSESSSSGSSSDDSSDSDSD